MSISRALQKIYNETLPTFNFWQQQESHLQPSNNPRDNIPSYGMDAGKYYYDYDGVYKPRYPVNPTKGRKDNVPRSALARATIDDYGDVMTNPSIIGGERPVEYVESEIMVAKKNGRKIAGYDDYYPVRDPPRHGLPVTSGHVDYDGRKEYDYNTHLWSTRDIVSMDNYPPKLDRLDFNRRIKLYNPELAGQTSGADAWRHEGARDEYDPVEDTFVLSSKELAAKRTGIYRKPLTEEQRYKLMIDGNDNYARAAMNDYKSGKMTHDATDRRECYIHPGIDYVTLEQARNGFSKAAPVEAVPITKAELIMDGARRSWEDIQNEKNYVHECGGNKPVRAVRAERAERQYTNPWDN
jgi:hypothetical protein